MKPTRHPTFCSPLDAHWPLPLPVPGAVLVSTRFDSERLATDAFIDSQIEQPASLASAVAKRQGEYLAGRLCARAALLQLTGEPDVPALGADRAPIWPPGTCGSITHSHGWAAAVVARCTSVRGLGLDAENLLSPERAKRLAAELLVADELQRLALRPDAQHALAVTLSFSLKESLFKALYPLVGVRFYFQHAEVLSWTEDGRARLRLLTDLSPEWHQGAELDAQFVVKDGRVLSLVSV